MALILAGTLTMSAGASGTLVTYSGIVDGNTCKGDVDFGACGSATFTEKK